jgi:hypothetical protein
MQKTGDMVQNGKKIYSYLKEADVKTAVQEQLKEQGLILVASLKGHTTGVRELKYPTSYAEVVITFTVTDIETGESISFDAPGFAHDSGDKAIYKAMAGAFKYAMTLNLQVPTGDDPEGDPTQHDNQPGKPIPKPKPLSDKELKEIEDMKDFINANVDRLKEGELRSDVEKFVKILDEGKKEVLPSSIRSAYDKMKEALSD